MSKALANKARISLALAVSALALGGCGWFGSDKDKPYVETPVEILYNRALDDLGQQDYKLAAKEFEEVDRQHPYSVWDQGADHGGLHQLSSQQIRRRDHRAKSEEHTSELQSH